MSDRPEKKINSKKLQRLESKKKKAAAFLDLVRPAETGTENQCTSNKIDDDNPAEKMNNSESSSVEMKEDNQEEDVLQEMKKIIRERKKAALQKPKVFLTLEDMVPFQPSDVEIPPESIPPLYVMDLQQLLLYGVQGNVSSFKPRWCKLVRVGKVKSVVVILIDGLGYSDFMENKECFPYITESFTSKCEMVCPLQYNRTVAKELHSVPLSVSQLKKANVKVPDHIKASIAAKLAKTPDKKDVTKMETDTKNTLEKSSISRKCLLLSTQQMMHEGYPLPIVTQSGNFKDFVFSKAEYRKVTESSPLLALDCEMCLTTARVNELTRVSIVSETGLLIYDTLVKPRRKIINYLTRYSGITKQMLDPVTTRIEDVQKSIREILPADAILCGQSLNSDLLALKIFHPYVVDTSVIFNMSGVKGIKAGLRKLTQFFLGRAIQNNPDGHCSHEDALAALDLVKLKLTKGLEFGDATLNGIYFPDIKTYFLGEDAGAKKTENIESETRMAPRPLTKSDSCEPNNSKEKLRLEKTKQAAVACADSSETSEEEENNSNDKSDEPPSKKIKNGDDSETKTKSETQFDFFKTHSTSALLEEQTQFLFSQENSVHISHSFFRLVQEAGRSGCVIDREAVTSNFMKEPIDIITVENDSVARKTAKQEIKSKEFLWVNFHEMADVEMEDPGRNKLMRKIDNRVKSVLKHAKEDALAVVVMTGHKDKSQLQNMMTFIKTT